jgi:threonylcarbamoyladenosine tRNA methylthiotransferase MtaB
VDVTTFSVKFLGCKVSQADAMLARSRLLEAGHREVPEAEAELHVINTCCITSEAEAKSRQSVRRSVKAGAGRVLVTGCAANLAPARFGELAPSVSALVGTAEEVAVEAAGSAGPGCTDLDHDVLAPRQLAGNRTRGFVKVQDGCDCECAYCIIPTVRGGARSRPAGAVLGEIEQRVSHGQPEVVLTDLGGLLRSAAAVEGVERVRLSSVEVIHVGDTLIDAVAEEPKVCSHLHVPMQSGDDQVLSAMGRSYDSNGYLRTIERLRERVGSVNVTTDVIVGFPTETEAAFERTLDTVQRAGITRIHTFSFSSRPGTVADRLGDPVPPEEKKRRSKEMRGLSEVLGRHHRSGKLGETDQVLIDKAADSQLSGYSEDYTRYYLPPDAGSPGSLVRARGHELYSDGVLATLEKAGS